MKEYLLMDLAGIHKIEDLHHHKCVEYKGVMTRVGVRLVKDD
jgi:hypothetical protein